MEQKTKATQLLSEGLDANVQEDAHSHHHDEQHNHQNEGGSSGGHNHAHLPTNLGFAFKLGLALTSLFVIGEFMAGFLSNSLALISDAGHNLTDALALAFSWWAVSMAKRAPTMGKTYGYHRAGILAATLNAVSLILISVYIFYEGVQRLLAPPAVNGWTVIVVANVALVVNLVVAWFLQAGAKDDLNTKSAFIHIAGDAAASVGVILAGVIEVISGWRVVDPIISMLIGLVILWSSWGIIKEAANVLFEGIPEGLDMVSLMRDLMKQPAVQDVHDLHVWTIGSGFRALSCHLLIAQNYNLIEANQVTQTISQMLKEHYNIGHATMQLECENCELNDTYCAPLTSVEH